MSDSRSSIPVEQNVRVKGDLVAAVVVGDRVTLWFASPTGGSSDSHLFDLPCRSEAQAEAVAKRHRDAWGLNDRNEKKEEEEV